MKKELICPECGEIYMVDISTIDYKYCCYECSICLYPEENYGEEG